MLKWLKRKPKLPISPEERDWIEENLLWLCGEFGYQGLPGNEILTPESHPSLRSTDASESTLHDQLLVVCEVMSVPREVITLELYDESTGDELAPGIRITRQAGTAGLYEEHEFTYTISVEQSSLGNPMSAVATLAHELAHVRLLGGGRVNSEEEDHEPLADLTAAFFGSGVFLANSSFRETHYTGVGGGYTSASRQGYLSMPMLSYALGLMAWVRGDNQPNWRDDLRPNARAWLDQSVGYLDTTWDTVFYPVRTEFVEDRLPETRSRKEARLQYAAGHEDYEYAASLRDHLADG